MNMRKFNHSFSRVRANLVVLTQATRIIKPSKSSLHYPTLPRFYIRRNINATMQQSISVVNESAAITFVRAISLYRRISTGGNHCRSYSHCCVGQIRSMNYNTQKTTQGIGCYLPLSAFVFFPRRNRVGRWHKQFLRSENQ